VDEVSVGEVSVTAQQVSIESVFCAYKGVHFDGHLSLQEAFHKGCRVFVLEDPTYVSLLPESVLWIQVVSGRNVFSWLAAYFADMPHEALFFIGITGTNGKTSTAWMIKSLLQAAGHASVYMGTLGVYIGEEVLEQPHTTPDPRLLFASLQKAKLAHIKYMIMEVSSHSLTQERLGPIKFDVVLFTSFSRDHLDYHGSMEAYWNAKVLMFTKYAKQKPLALVHESLVKKLHISLTSQGVDDVFLKTYSLVQDQGSCDYQITWNGLCSDLCKSVVYFEEGSLEITHPYAGSYACENFLAAWIVIRKLIGKSHIDYSKLSPVPGRLEPVIFDEKLRQKHWIPVVYIDYAHTPDALEKTLLTLRQMHCHARMFLVFGCGGDRDQGKRTLMGEVASRLADYILLTSDNPRMEDPGVIASQIHSGSSTSHRRGYSKSNL
jgi:UDP-N-acetylmuramyl-tripeptide synthetase